MLALLENNTPEIVIAIFSEESMYYSKLGIEKYRLELQAVENIKRQIVTRLPKDDYQPHKLLELLETASVEHQFQDWIVKRLSAFETQLISTCQSSKVKENKSLLNEFEDNNKLASRYDLALKGMNDGIWDWDIPTDEVYYSPQWKKMLGYEDHELENKLQTWHSLMHPEDAVHTVEIVKNYLNKKTPSLYHLTRFLHKDGTYRNIVCRGYMQLDENGTPIRMVGSHTDISEVTRMGLKLKQQKELFELAIKASNEGIWDWNLENNDIYFSPRWKSMFGYTDEELPNSLDTWRKLILKEDQVAALKQVDEIINTDRTFFEIIQRFIHKDGHIVFVKSRAIKVKNNEDKVYRLVGSHADISDYMNAQTLLLRSEEKYRGIIENMNLGLLHVDNDDVIIDVFDKFCSLTGYSKHELLGKKASQLLAGEEDGININDLLKARKRKESSTYERLIRCKDGSKKWLLISGTPEIDKNGKVVGSIGIHLDITERKQMELALLGAKQLAENYSKSREKLLARVSHEMRTPMQAFFAFVNYLETQQLSQELSEYIHEVKIAMQSLNSLVNDLLDMNSIQMGKLTLIPKTVGVRKAMENLINYYRRLVPTNKNIKIEYSVSDNLPDSLIVDPFRVQQILGNLISNAIKYTDHGSITCKVNWKKNSNNGGIVIVKISDTGIGIPKEQLDWIFQEFFQVRKESNMSRPDGVGLGLAIVKQLIDLMRGEINVESQLNFGTTFTVFIPTKIACHKSNLENKPSDYLDQKSPQHIRVLIAEDNIIIRRLISMYLIDNNFYVDAVVNGFEAVKLFSNQDYDFVLMDINMPITNGYEAAREMREIIKISKPFSNTRIVALSASVVYNEEENKRLIDFDDFLQKPLDLQALIKYLQRNYKEKEMLHINSGISVALPEKLVDTPEDFFSDLELDSEFKENMIPMLVKELEKDAKAIRKHIAEENIEQLKYTLHLFKSTAGILRLKETIHLINLAEERLKTNLHIDDDCLLWLNTITYNIITAKNRLLNRLQ